MPLLRIDLETTGRHWLELQREPDGWRAHLVRNRSDRRCPLHEALLRHLRLEWPGVSRSLEGDQWLPEGVEIIVRLAEGTSLARVLLSAEEARGKLLHTAPLSSFETRYLAENNRPYPVGPRHDAPDFGLSTDLHTHFAGCVRPTDLLRIGREQDVCYSATLLAAAGIHVGQANAAALEALPARCLDLLAEQLAIPEDRQITFLDLERIYRLRSPITRSLAAFLPLCRQIAADYAAMGVRYVEQSMGGIVEAERLRLAHAELPAIEQETGVMLRFLAAMSRHNDPEWSEDYLDRLREVAESRYLAGVDFMGHETNSTRDFAPQLRAVAEWAGKRRPGLVVRVHAGENPAYPENVRVALECVGNADVILRIGHGLYGVDTATQAALRERRAIVEFNLSSNFALNNLQSLVRAPIRDYLAAGIRVALGTDGYGIYQTTPAVEARLARLAGLADEDLAAIHHTEQEYVASRAASEARTLPPAAFRVPPDTPPRHYTPEVAARRAAANRVRDTTLEARLAELGTPLLDEAGVGALLRGRLCLSLAGAWRNSWERVSEEQREQVRVVLAELFSALDPAETVLITGGTRHGVEGLAHSLARPLGFPVLAVLVSETPPASLEQGEFTHAFLAGERFYDKAAGLYSLLRQSDSFCLFIGGGPIVNDEIQAAANLRIRYLLMDGPEGASTEHAREQPHRAFRTAQEALDVLRSKGPWRSAESPYWHLGANPTVDIVLLRRSPHSDEDEVLLIQRDPDAPTEPGKWALPGGFVHTHAPPGTLWTPGAETEREACLRELWEETGLDLRGQEAELLPVGEYEGSGRDPRDSPERWSRAVVFALRLPEEWSHAVLAGGDDARDARWLPLSAVPADLAFDHERLLRDALAVLHSGERH